MGLITPSFISSPAHGTPGGLAVIEPDQINDLQIWYEAAKESGLSDTDLVATVTDHTGNGFDLSQSTSSKKPQYLTGIIGSQPVFRFDGSEDLAVLSGGPHRENDSAATVAAIITPRAVGGNLALFSQGDAATNNTRAFVGHSGSTSFIQVRNSGGSINHSAEGDALDQDQDTIVIYRADTTDGYSVRENGTEHSINVTGTDGTWWDVVAGVMEKLALGALSAATETFHWQVDVAVCLYYSRRLTDPECQQLELSYAQAKYGISVA